MRGGNARGNKNMAHERARKNNHKTQTHKLTINLNKAYTASHTLSVSNLVEL